MKYFKYLLASLAMSVAVAGLNAAPVLIGHPDLAGVTLEGSSLEAVLLGKNVSLNGTRVVLVLAKSGAAEDTFLKTKINKSDKQLQNHWRRLFMTGGGSAPTNVADEAAVANTVASTPGAIGIVDESAAGDLPILTR